MPARKITFKVSRADDADFESLYGGCFVAKCSDGWESEKRSTEARAEADAADHIATLDDGAPAEDE